jgi:uncharacterized SAM-binding protein YcdF (DUF218 family)
LAYCAARLLIVHPDWKAAEAIVVLSGSATYNERVDLAAQLYRAGQAPLIVLTDDKMQGGWSEILQRNPYSFERGIQRLMENGVPSDRIIVLHEQISGTYEEAVVLRDYTQQHQMKSLLFITSAYHSRRAWWTVCRVFRSSNTSVSLQAAQTGAQTPNPGTWWLHPAGWRMVPTEYGKMAYYWFRIG